MISIRNIFASTAAISVSGLLSFGSSFVRADDEVPPPPQGEGKKEERPNWRRDGDGRRSGLESPFDSLSEAEKAELRSAMDAVWHDPGVLAAREAMLQAMQKSGDAYKEALRKSMENSNPKIREILTKMMESHPSGDWGHRPDRRPEESGEKGAGGGEKDPPFFKGLSEEDRQILRDAREKADKDEGVTAAMARKEAAQTMEEKIEALRDLREALHKAMTAADPRVNDILKKLPVPGRDRGDGRKGEGKDRKDDSAPDGRETSAGREGFRRGESPQRPA